MSLKIILASASPRRQELLRQVGLSLEILPSHADESGVSGTPEEIVKELSVRKAAEVMKRLEPGRLTLESFSVHEKDGAGFGQSETVLLAADTVVAVDGRILGKPRSTEEAARMIDSIQGRSHHVHTGVTMYFLSAGEQITFSEVTEVTVYPMTRGQIGRYVDTGEPMDKAGAYGIQGYFAAYVKEIRGDYNNVVGLPVARVCQELRLRGLW